jgi:hypothetical protein
LSRKRREETVALQRPLLKLNTVRSLLAGGLLIVLIGGLAVFRQNIATSWELATSQHPEHYTALYFLNTGHLPTYAPAKKQQNLSFGITNYQGSAVTYHYVAQLTSNGSTVVLGQGAVTLTNGQAATEHVTFTISTPNTPATITIKLQGRAEVITFRTQS